MKFFLFLFGILVGAGGTLALDPDPSWVMERFQGPRTEGAPVRSASEPRARGSVEPAPDVRQGGVRERVEREAGQRASRALEGLGDALGGGNESSDAARRAKKRAEKARESGTTTSEAATTPEAGTTEGGTLREGGTTKKARETERERRLRATRQARDGGGRD